MRRRLLLPAVGLVAIVVATALAVVGIASLGGDDPSVAETVPGGLAPVERPRDGGLPDEGISATGAVVPRTILFGDAIAARIDVLLDRRKVDPASVRVSTEFVPWEIVGAQTRVRRDAGHTTWLRTGFTLRCTGSPCLPANESSPLEFNTARVTYAPLGGARERRTVAVDFPILLVYSRFAAANLDGPAAASSIPWRADLESFPAVGFRVAPALLVPVLVVLAGLLALAGAALAFVAIPRRQPEPEPEPEPEQVIVLTPLEQALELLEDAGRADGAEDRRRALELVAEVLDVDHPGLARAARSLAWSEDDPLVEQTRFLATQVRTTIDTTTNGDGRVP